MEISRQIIFSFIFFVFLMMITGTAIADEVNVEFVSRFGGYVNDVVVTEDYAYLGQGQDLVILKISDAANPSVVGRVTTLSAAYSVAVAGNYAYVADGGNGLVIVDISNPSSPIIAGSYDTADYAYDVAVAGNYAYVVDHENGLVILDISNPSSPTIAGSYDTANYACGVAVAGNYAYVADGGNGLVIVDISNPSSPTLIGNYDTVGNAHDVAVAGNYAYIADSDDGLVILDINNPSSPTLIGNYDTADNAYDVAVAGNYVYVADDNKGLVILDISNPSSPTLIGNYDTADDARDVAVAGNYAYIADDNKGLVILDISNPSSPTLESNYDTICYTEGVSIAGNYAYIADGFNGLVVMDISNPSSPTLVGNYDTADYHTTGYACDVAVAGNYAYVTDDNKDLVILDISNPLSPTLKGNYETDVYVFDVAVAGNYAYIAGELCGLVILDISNPSLPTLAGSCDTSGCARGIAVAGNYAYIADDDDGLVVMDISNPSSPTLIGNYDTVDYARDVAVAGNYAYVADNNKGLVILDISNPSSPTLESNYDTDGNACDVTVEGNYAYIADGDSGLVILDISNPSSPTLAESYGTVGSAQVVAVAGNYVYVADGSNGLAILKTNLKNQKPTEGSLIQAEGSSDVYLIENGEKHLFTSPEALLWNGYSFDDITTITSETLKSYPDGKEISISQPIIDKYHELGGAPIFGASAGEGEKDGDKDSAGTYCSYVNFENGSIEYFKNVGLAGKAYAIFNPFFNKWASMGYAKSVLGYPIDNMSDVQTSKFGTKFRYQNFANGTEEGALEYNLSSDKVFEIHGAIFTKWSALGYANSELGLVTSDERDAVTSFKGTTGRVSDFENGHLHWHNNGDHSMTTYMTYGDLDKFYIKMGGTASDLGFPVMDQKADGNGHDYCEFEGGNISWDDATSSYKANFSTIVDNSILVEKVKKQIALMVSNDPMKDYDMTAAYFWMDLAGELHQEEYDEYMNNVELYRGLQLKMLQDALVQARRGDEEKVNRDLNLANIWGQNAEISFRNACGLLDHVLKNTYFVAEEVQTGSVIAFKIIGTAVGIYPGSLEALDIIVMAYDDVVIEGKTVDQTKEEILWNAARDAVLGHLIKDVTDLPGMNGQTIEQFLSSDEVWRGRTAKDVYKILSATIGSDETTNAVFLELQKQYPSITQEFATQTWDLAASQIDKQLNSVVSYQTASIESPGELRVYDFQGRVTGLVNGEIVEGIPNSVYDSENKSVIILESSDTYRYDVVGTGNGEYGLKLLSVNGTQYNPVHLQNTVVPNEVDQYTVDWNNIETEKAITLDVDSNGDGTFDENTKIPLPTASFTNTSLANQHISFDGSSSEGNIVSYKWDFGDGTSDDGQIVDHMYANEGYYDVTLVVRNSDGGMDSEIETIKIGNIVPILPIANFSTNVSEDFAPLTVQFNDSSENATGWKWDFGDGNTSTDQNPMHIFFTAGEYTVNLTIINEYGTDSKTATITVLEKTILPVANFSAKPTLGKAPLKVAFTDTSTGSPTSWFWNFGDGSKSYLQNPIHKYSKAGIYTVNLTVKNAAGRNTVTKTEYIKVITKPAANFSATPTSGKASLKVKFTDTSTGIPAKWFWNFGDGAKSFHQNPIHKYSKAGTYTVNLTVKNAKGKNTVTKTEYIKVITKPVANFTSSVTSGKTPLKVKFTDTSTGIPAKWVWDFGDGSKSYHQNPTHKYSKAGTYTVNLTVKNAKGKNTVTKTEYIKVTV